MSHLFAAILLFSSPGCPHEEPTCITPTEYVKVDFSSTGRVPPGQTPASTPWSAERIEGAAAQSASVNSAPAARPARKLPF